MTDEQQARQPARDPRQKALKEALRIARDFYSPQQMIDAGARMRPAWKKMTDTALRTFIDSNDVAILQPNYDALAAFWLDTPLGRALRFPDPKQAPDFDKLSYKLASGQRTLPEGMTADGVYFVYAGSYIEPDRFAVRVFEIDSKDDHILTVRDTIRDNITLAEGDRASSGALVFVDGVPQIVLYGLENKRGFSLMIGTEAVPDDEGRLSRMVGAFLVMTKNHAVAYRRFLMMRKPDGDREQMIAESGIFTRDELRAPQRRHHSAAFDKLAKHKEAETPFADPILAYQADENG